MNILLIHNDNLPDSLSKETLQTYGVNLDERNFKLKPTDKEPLDTFICETVGRWLSEENVKYDIIMLPFSLTEHHIEYTGLRIAAHIRLTKEWLSQPNKYIATPILFLGPDQKEDVIKFSNLGIILLSYNIYTTNKTKDEEIISILEYIQNNNIDLPDNYNDIIKEPEYKDLLNRLSGLKPPANYATHHSIANEWAIMRWIDMIAWDDRGKPQIFKGDFQNMLYFKYLMAKVGVRENFTKSSKKNNPITPFFPNIHDAKIMFIDDEVDKGWGELLNIIFKNSGAKTPHFYPFTDKSLDKNAMLTNIEKYIEDDYYNNGGADCYIIDLRLHDDDFKNQIKFQELSGHKLLSFIKEKNPTNQVILLTASNKIWNYKKAINDRYGVNGYVIKESPEQLLNKAESKQLFDELSQSIQKAYKMKYLRELYIKLDGLKQKDVKDRIDFSLLYEFINLLNLDNGKNDAVLLKAAALSLNVFIEKHIEEQFSLEPTMLAHKEKDLVYNWSGLFSFRVESDPENSNRKRVVEMKEKAAHELHEQDCEDPSYKTALSRTIITLRCHYNIPVNDINSVITLINDRNALAHKGQDITLNTKDMYDIMNNVVFKMIDHDITNS